MTVLLTALGPRCDGPVVRAIEGSPHLRVARRCADLAELLSSAEAGIGELALVSADLRGLTLSAVARLRESGVEVIGVSDPHDSQSELRLWQLGVAAVVSAGAEPSALTGEVLAAATPAPRADHTAGPPVMEDVLLPRERRGRVVTVWGPPGSPGRTTVAVGLATELAALGREVLLVDADTYAASVAQTLAILDEAAGVVAATRAADQGALDVMALARLAPLVGERLRVLTGLPRADRWPEVRGASLQRVLEVGRSLVDDVVVDIASCLEQDEELSYDTSAPRRNQAALAALEEADLVLAVGGCDPVSLQRFVRGLQSLAELGVGNPRVVVNRLRPGPVGSPPDQRVGSALDRFAGVRDVHYVPEDLATLDTAVLQGRSLLEHAPASPARLAIRDLAASLTGVTAASGGRRRRR